MHLKSLQMNLFNIKKLKVNAFNYCDCESKCIKFNGYLKC